MSIDARIAELGITLPEPAKAVANYVPYVQSGNLLHISGQLSNDASGGIKGTVGADVLTTSPDATGTFAIIANNGGDSIEGAMRRAVVVITSAPSR